MSKKSKHIVGTPVKTGRYLFLRGVLKKARVYALLGVRKIVLSNANEVYCAIKAGVPGIFAKKKQKFGTKF